VHPSKATRDLRIGHPFQVEIGKFHPKSLTGTGFSDSAFFEIYRKIEGEAFDFLKFEVFEVDFGGGEVGAGAEDFWSNENCDFVDQVGTEEGGGHFCAGFDED